MVLDFQGLFWHIGRVPTQPVDYQWIITLRICIRPKTMSCHPGWTQSYVRRQTHTHKLHIIHCHPTDILQLLQSDLLHSPNGGHLSPNGGHLWVQTRSLWKTRLASANVLEECSQNRNALSATWMSRWKEVNGSSSWSDQWVIFTHKIYPIKKSWRSGPSFGCEFFSIKFQLPWDAKLGWFVFRCFSSQWIRGSLGVFGSPLKKWSMVTMVGVFRSHSGVEESRNKWSLLRTKNKCTWRIRRCRKPRQISWLHKFQGEYKLVHEFDFLELEVFLI